MFESNGLSVAQGHGRTGLVELTGQDADRGRFKPPSLRNVALTGPYLHDGSIASLGEVIDRYAGGGLHTPQQSPQVRGFTLTTQERADLLAFLESLSDYALLEDPRFSDPWR